jgi:hypothetical protein
VLEIFKDRGGGAAAFWNARVMIAQASQEVKNDTSRPVLEWRFDEGCVCSGRTVIRWLHHNR